jgi:hypothetical protein
MLTMLGFQSSSGPAQGNHVHPILLEVVIQFIAVIDQIPDEILRLGLNMEKLKLSCRSATS